MIDKKTFSIGFVIFMIVLTFYLWKNNDYIAQIIANDGFTGVLWYTASNPAYILLLFTILMSNPEAGFFKNILGTFMITYASDIISYPRLPPTAFPTSIDILASTDGLAIHQLLKFGLSYQNAWTIYYLVLPITLVLGALKILGIANVFKAFGGKA